MIRLLLNHFFSALKSLQVQTIYMVNPKRTKAVLVFILLIGLLSNTSVFGQQVDTWFRAGKGVNSPTFPLNYADPLPLPPADGTPVTTWYDIVYTVQQNLIPNPNPIHYPNPWFLPVNPGFDYPYPNSGSYDLYLTPTGSIPGLPTLRRNLASNINFNPVVNFDGSGDGQALHFRSDSRENVTVFVVFRAQGAGNSAETQRLLLGGDIENHHTSFNQDEWTTNLSLGVADGNVFSIGRTWDGDGGGFFQPGSIDLMGLPSIGTFTRSTSVDSERLDTYVNGLNDIGVNRNHALADNPLFFFNRVGKHFNSNDSNRNLTGDIAEILLADFSLSTTQRQMVETYLAIKYGITLNTAGQLGSIVGNLGYSYLASDGTVIWDPALDSNYRYDIAGLGRDRFDDIVGGLSLRYDQHQRISQSVNSGAIVAMSTNTNFATDNLDQSRTEIDNTTWGAPSLNSHLHNYLIWASDRGSVNQTAVELPTGYSARIEREWQIQKTVSPGGVDPINNVSVRVDLSGSDMLSNPNCGTLVLLIDNDGDGDFLTGTLTSIPATSVDGANNAYFDNVTFEHTQVFTIAFLDDEDPTASDQVSTVCDTPPAVDPDVIDDETDNCGIASVTFISETTDNLSNPETIVRTYRVTDIYGNFIDVTHTIYVYTSPVVDEPADVSACDSYALPNLTTGSYFTGSGGTGTPLSAGDVITSSQTIYVYAATGPVPCTDEHSFTVTITPAPVVGAGSDEEICQGDAHDLSNSGTVPTESGTSSLLWSSAGDGSFDDATMLAPTYTPGVNDIANGSVVLTLTGSGNGSCGPVNDSMELTITPAPVVGAGSDQEICQGDTHDLSNSGTVPTESGTSSLIWSSAGDGSFDDATMLAPTYTPGVNDIANGSVVLTLTGSGNGSCGPVNDSMELTITPAPVVGAGSDQEICQGDTHDLSNSGTVPTESGTSSLIWSSAGDGSFDDATMLAPTYTPGVNDIANGSVVLTLTGSGNGSCGPVNDSMELTITPAPVVGAGSDEEICQGDAHDLSNSGTVPTESGTSSLLWSSAGDGSFDDATMLAPTYTPGVNDIANGSVVLTLTGSGNGSCGPVNDSMELTITPAPVVDAGSDEEICQGDSHDLSNSGTVPTESGTSSLIWSSAGDGSFDDATMLAPTYTPGVNDIANGSVVLTLTGSGNGSCGPVNDSMTLTITPAPVVGAGSDQEICQGDAHDFSASGVPPSASNTSALLWQTAGDGTFSDANILLPVYTPGANDIANGSVVLTLRGAGNGSCGPVNDSMTLTINDRPTIGVSLFSDPTSCSGNDGSITLIFTNVPNGNYDIVHDTGIFNAVPVNAGSAVVNGLTAGNYDNLRITVNGCTSTEYPDVTLTNPGAPIANAGSDGDVCGIGVGNPFATNAVAAVGTGTWSNETPLVGTATFADPNDETTNVTVHAYGTYTFRWTDVNGTCSGFDEITVTFDQQPEAGTPTDLAICEGDATAYDLSAQLAGEDPGGTWTDVDDAFGNGANSVVADPANMDFNAIAPGTYRFTYTVSSTGACPDDSATVEVQIDGANEAGTPTDLAICEGDATAYDLSAQLAGEDPGGTWTDVDDAFGNGANSVVADPANMDFNAIAPGTYRFTYTVSSTGACPDDSATVEVQIDGANEAGTPTDLAICEGDATAYDLSAQLAGEDPGGTWTDVDDAFGNGANSVVADPANMDFNAIAPGTYRFTYTVSSTGACPDDSATVEVQIDGANEAGTPTDLAICEGDATAYDLSAQLAGEDPGGTWTDVDDAFGNGANSVVADPANMDFNAIAPGTYRFTYTVSSTGACPDDSATVEVQIDGANEAGTPTDLAICEGDATAYDLSAQLAGEDPGGTWTDVDDAFGNGANSVVADPANMDFNAIAPGTYRFTYTVSSTGACPDDSATVEVQIDGANEAGTPTDLAICEGDATAYDLSAQLAGEDPGGTWTDVDDAFGNGANSVVADPANMDFNAIAPGTYRFTYTVSSTGACPDDSATVEVQIDGANEAGTPTDLAICEGDATAYDLSAQLAGEDPGGTWTDVDDAFGNGANSVVADPANMDFNAIAPGTYRFTYTVSSTGACPDDSATVEVQIDGANEAGTPTDLAICEGDATAYDLSAQLAGEDPGGTWTDVDDAFGNGANSVVADPANMDFNAIAPGTYRFTYTVSSTGACPDDSATVEVQIDGANEAGTPTDLAICEGDATAYDLSAQLAGEDPGGTWTDVDDAFGNGANSVVADPANMDFNAIAPGTYRFTYTVSSTGACPDDSATVEVQIDGANEAGTPTDLAICEGDATAYDLSAQLAGEDPGGTWTDVDDAFGNGANSVVADPANMDFNAIAPGTYRFTYTVSSTGACPDDSATVEVQIDGANEAGTPTDLAICEGDATAYDLSAQLAGEDPGGTWTDVDDAFGNGANSVVADPANMDFNAIAPGTYRFTYTVSSTGACPDDSATVEVQIDGANEAGTPTDLAICEGDATAYDLSAQLAGEDPGGTWTDVDDAFGNGANSVVADPANMDFNAIAPGTYRFTYTVSSTGACPDDSATVEVQIDGANEAGTPTDLAICEGDATAYDLSAQLAGEDPGGTWTDVDDAFGNGANSVVADPANMDFNAIAPGTYRFTYTVSSTGACPDDSATVEVQIDGANEAGTPTDLAICEGDATAYDLSAQLAGEDPGGTWTDVDDAFGNGANSVVADPANMDFNAIAPGTYRFTYTVSSTGACPDDSATVEVQIDGANEAGTPTDLAICEGDATAYDLSAQLAGEDPGGTWTDVDDAFGNGANSVVADPANMDFNAIAPGTYRFTYTVSSTGACPDDSATVEVQIDGANEAGTPTDLAICEGDATAYDLSAQLAGEDPGGTWTDVDDAFGNGANSVVADPANMDFNAIAPGTYRFTYTVSSTGACPDDSATVEVQIDGANEAGTPTDLAICEGDATAYDLSAQLAGEDPGGTWTDVDDAFGNGANSVVADPANMDFNAIAPGTYRFTYTVSSTGACPDDSATVEVQIDGANEAGTPTDLAICEGDATAYDLSAQLAGEDPGRTWTDVDDAFGNGANSVVADPANMDFNAIAPGTYRFTYTVSSTGACPDDSATVEVQIDGANEAGTPTDLAICEGDATAYDLSAQLAGEDPGGTWTDVDDAFGNGANSVVADPANMDFNAIAPGTYRFTYTVSSTGACPDDSATVEVQIDGANEAGTPTDLAICEGDATAYDLSAQLAGEDPGGTWTDVDDAFGNGANSVVADPANMDFNAIAPGTYRFTYTVSSTGACPDDSATVEVQINNIPTVDDLEDVTTCDSYTLPELTNGNYFTGSGGTGTPLFEGDVINTSQTIFVFSPEQGNCPDSEESFEVTITGFTVTTNVEHESCWESDNGSVFVVIGDAEFPITVQLNNMAPMVFNTDSFSIDDLSPGNYEISVIDDTGCETNTSFSIQPGGANLGGSVDVLYSCDANLPSNTIAVTLFDPSVSNDVLYALDSTDPNDFTLSPDFGNISPGDHSLFIMDNNGCIGEIPFEVESFEPLELTLTSEYVNQITANVTGGTAPYTYYFDNNSGTDSNTYAINRSGTVTVRVVDSNGCEVFESTTMNLMEITIPNFFTPNNDGQNDFWRPRNIEQFPDIETYIFDRYGRKIWIIGPLDQGWDGTYESRPLPSGDYWYIVRLNDGTGREYVGNFTLYR